MPQRPSLHPASTLRASGQPRPASVRRGGAATVIVQVLAIVGLAFVIGAVNLMQRPVTAPVSADGGDASASQARIDEIRAERERRIAASGQGTTEASTNPAPTPPAGGDPQPTTPTSGEPTTPTTAQPQGTTPTGAEGAQPATAAAGVPGGISVAEAKQLWDEGAIFIDTRKTEAFQAGHVEASMRLTIDMITQGSFGDVLLFLQSDPNVPVVVYCDGGQCDESQIVRERLVRSGFPNIKIMVDGFPGWKAAGHPVAFGG